MSASSRNRTAKSSGKSSTARGERIQDVITMPPVKELKFFDSCAATASMFLYAQGSSIVCCHHDSLTIETRFSRHTGAVEFLAVDNQSEAGGGRLVVSYDTSETALIWDLMTGDVVATLNCTDICTTAAWMRNGNVAFGTAQGVISLFEPRTSEWSSSRTIDQIAVTALAPSADCRTFAIGYQNGSLLIATLQPRFTILHSLTTSRAPSPIVTLAWHASSTRQKSDMLAVQTHDGDLRVWSVSKNYSVDDPAKVVRILRRRESSAAGPNWMGWSKNGRVIQFSDSETLSWDVRTKHVTFDSIPTLEHVKGLAVYGPGATLFTLGPNGTVQQFDLNSPSIMVANVQHPIHLLPPSPPNSIEEPSNASAHSVTTIHTSESESSSVPFDVGVSESDEDQLSPFARFSRRPHLDSSGGEISYDSGSPVSSRSGLSSLSKSSAGSRTPGHYPASLRSRGMTENTYISAGSSLKSSTIGRKDLDTYSMGYSLPSTSVPSMVSSRPRHRPSRLRHEVPRSPDDNKVHDLFKFTRTRLSDIPYKHPMRADNSRLTNDDLRKQMLSTIFGWHKPVEDMIQDEMSRHPAGSASRILLAKWLGDMNADIMVGSSENMSSSDWMLLALSGIGGQQSQHKLGRAYVQRLLENGDVHVAVTIMLGMGDHNDAIEIYISHKRYMEALILTCVAFPSVWERQAAIIRKWGEWAVQHGQQQLAIRCFACTDQESTEPWSSPSAVQLNFQSIMAPSIPEILSPPLSPPGVQRGPQRSIAKSSSLRLITSFGEQSQKSRFYTQGDGGQTPIAAGVTPIAESAITPAGYDVTTAFLRPSSNSRFNTPTSARPNASSYGRGRLPSIGEVPSDLNREALQAIEKASQDEHRHGHGRMSSTEHDNLAAGILLQRAATASPMMMRDGFQKVVRGYEDDRPLSPNQDILTRMQAARSNHRNGSRDRIPRGVNLQLKPLEQPIFADVNSPEQSVTSSTRFHWPSRRRGPGSVASSITSTSSAGRSVRMSQRHRDDYINSLEAANHYSKRNRSRGGSTERGARESSRDRHGSRERRVKSREASQERGRASARSWTKPKRSPTSPIPMSPEDLAKMSTPKYCEVGEPITARKPISSKAKTGSRASSRSSQRHSPDGRPRPPALDIRGRTQIHDGSHQRSPSSPLPLSATAALHYQGSEDEEDFKRAIEEQEGFRAKHSRSANRGFNSSTVTKGDGPESRRREAAEALDALPPRNPHTRAASTEHAGDLRQMKDERQRKKELAARELEDRRKSLAKRPQAPQIPHPNEINSTTTLRIGVETTEPEDPEDLHPRCATEPPKSMYARSGPPIGLPATPKAMRLILEAENSSNLSQDTSDIPQIPTNCSQQSSGPSSQKDVNVEPLTLLPSTVYQPPQRLAIPRSMSAPIPDEPEQSRYPRKGSVGEIRGIDEVINGRRRRSQEEPIPPPPPPVPTAPPMLKELQHLAMPPPPPPAPLPYAQRSHKGGALASGMIEIVMDEEDDTPIVAAPNDGMVPVLAPPAPPSRGHNRGRSNGNGSLSGGLSRNGERLRSVSRSRKDSKASIKSPPLETPSEGAYRVSTLRSPISGVPPPIMYDPNVIRTAIEPNGKHISTGLHRSEMI
ncbi:WD40 repeat-like-containing domain protein [Metarhizium rileyi]|uniref:WD40 repeat-like-containing domain protein n=1 Tax=Metarhizium rileyi (strain RCEF 4871) TaxID=1649241 RepID=A0A162HWN4_METRR|nr:WD40 repeat-like-containing domain protein [Metarhizium rileyi RCEF 4871]